MNVSQVFVALPLTYANIDELINYENSTFYKIFMECDTLGYNCSIFIILSLSLDRLVTFVGCRCIQGYEKCRILIMICLSWIYGFSMLISTLICGIYKLYDRSNYTLVVVSTVNSPSNDALRKYEEMTSRYSPILFFIIYVICFIKALTMKLSNTNTSSRSTKWKYEKRILYQGFAFLMFYELEALLFYSRDIASNIFGKENIRFYFIISNSVVIMFTCFNSIILYIFNEVARNNLSKLFGKKKVCNNVTITVVGQTTKK